MATAFSYRQVMAERVKWQSRIGRIHPSIFSPYIRIIYDYRRPGYADWKLYEGDIQFADGLIALLALSKAAWLEANGVPLGEMMVTQLDKIFLARKNEVML